MMWDLFIFRSTNFGPVYSSSTPPAAFFSAFSASIFAFNSSSFASLQKYTLEINAKKLKADARLTCTLSFARARGHGHLAASLSVSEVIRPSSKTWLYTFHKRIFVNLQERLEIISTYVYIRRTEARIVEDLYDLFLGGLLGNVFGFA